MILALFETFWIGLVNALSAFGFVLQTVPRITARPLSLRRPLSRLHQNQRRDHRKRDMDGSAFSTADVDTVIAQELPMCRQILHELIWISDGSFSH